MAIERLSFPHYLNIQAGIEIHPSNLPDQMERIMRRFGSFTRRLKEGEYDLTPPIWTEHIHRHTLTVLDSGLGIVRLIPRFVGSHSGMLDYEGTVTDFRPGGRLINIQQDTPIAVVVGPNRLNPNVCLYELVYYIPGSSLATRR